MMSLYIAEMHCSYPRKLGNGTVNVAWPAKEGALAEYECNPGFKMIGESRIYCHNERWTDNNSTKCESEYC